MPHIAKLCFTHLTSVDIIHLQNKIYNISAFFHGATSFSILTGGKGCPKTHSVFQKTTARHTTITFPLTRLPIPSLVTSSKKKTKRWQRWLFCLRYRVQWNRSLASHLFFFFFICYFHKGECGWFSPSPAMYWHPESNIYHYRITHCPTLLPKRSKANDSNERIMI